MKTTKYLPHKFYAILDYSYIGKEEFYNVANHYLLSGIKLIEVKILNKSKEFIVEIIKKILELKNIYEFSLILYENIDIVKELKLDGIHLDGDEISIAKAKEFLGDIIIAKACYSYENAVKAYRDGASFIVLGPLFHSCSEKYMGHYNYISLEELKKSVESINIPIVAFGGVNLSNIVPIIETKVDAVTVVSNIFQDASPMEKIRSVISLFDGDYCTKAVGIVNMSDSVVNTFTNFLGKNFKGIFKHEVFDVNSIPELSTSYNMVFYCIGKENVKNTRPVEEICESFNIPRNKLVILTDMDSHLFRKIVEDYKSLALLYTEDKTQINILSLIIESVIKK